MKPYTDIEQSRLNTMTQEEKAKAYDKAVERAKSKIKNDKDHVLYEDDVIELFPELAESEDEKTRKEITEFFKNFSEHGTWKAISDVTRWIAWLEKQGEKPNNVYDKELSEILGCVIRRYINDPNISYTEREKVSREIIPYVERLEKQGNKPTDKFEPKFKVGDWVVQENIGVYKVIEVCESWYEVIDGEDNHYSISFDKEYMCRLWDITKDAKDGDVLVCPLPKCYEGGEQIFIFKCVNSWDYVDNCIEYYCRVYEGVFYEKVNGYMGTTSSPLYPATKEQREQLEKSMADAGFTFDFEKKEMTTIHANRLIKKQLK